MTPAHLQTSFALWSNKIEFGSRQKILAVAHDMGAYLALIWAADHPDEMVCLVCMEVFTVLEEFLSSYR